MITIGYFPGRQRARTSPRTRSPSGGSGGSSAPTNPALETIKKDVRHLPADTIQVRPTNAGTGGSSSTPSTTGSASAKVDLAADPETPGGASGSAARSTHDFRSGGGASIVSGKPAGYALAKQQYIRDILDQQAAVRKQRSDQEFLNRPGPYGMPPGTVTGAPAKTYEPTARGGIEKAKYYLSKKSAALEGRAATKRASGKSGVGTAAAAFGVGFAAGAVGFVSAVAHPVRTAKGLYYTARDPMGSGAKAGAALATRPVQTTGETAGTLAAGYGAGKLIGKGVQQARKLAPVKVKSFQADKAHVKTKQVVPGSDTVLKSEIRQTAKGRVQVGGKEYAVKTTGRAKAVTTDTGKSVTVGKTKIGVTDVTKISKGKTKYRPAGSRFVSEAQRTGDKAKVSTVQTTAVKTGRGKYARAQEVSTSKGAKVLEVKQGVSVTTQTKKGAKTVKPIDVEQWQYKTQTRTTKTQQVGKTTAKIRKIKPLSPSDADKILKTKRPTGASVTTQRRTKGLEITRETFYKKTPAVRTKTTSTQVVKGKTYQASIPKKPVVKPLVTKTARGAGRAARVTKDTTVKMLQSKKASIADVRGFRPVQPRHTDAWPKTPSDLKPAVHTITRPRATVRVTSLPELQQALYAGAKSAARLTYIYAPVRGAGAIGLGAGAAGVASTKLPSAITVKPLERDLVSPVDRTKPATMPAKRLASETYIPPFPKTGPDVKITVVPEVTYPGTVTTPTPAPAPFPTPFITPLSPPLPPGVPRASMPPGGGIDSWSRALLKKSKQPKGYTPSATAMAFSIEGKDSKTGSKTGLGLRPIVVPKGKKKQKYRF